MKFFRRLSQTIWQVQLPALWMRRRLNSFRSSLSAKLVVIIILVSLLGVFTSSILVLTLQRQQLENSALAASIQEGTVISIGLEHAMLSHDQTVMSHLVQNMVDSQHINHIRILDANGVVRISSLPVEIGERFDYSKPTCQFCHTNGARSNNQSTIIGAEDGHETLLDVVLIFNQPECQSCHDAKNQVLGITMIETPLVGLDHQLSDGFWRIALSGLVTLGVLIAFMVMALRRLVTQPVDRLTRGMTEMRRGNLDYGLPQTQPYDELGELAAAFDTLRAQLKSTQAENSDLQKRIQSLAIMQERERLAREMHDNLAQTLGYINLKAAMADSELVLKQMDQARASVLELKRAAKEAYTDVRESIFNLRNARAGDGLLVVLTQCVREYRAQSGIDVQLCVPDNRLAEFPAEVEVQVQRIIQEALTNVRKHSGASHASIRFDQIDSHVQIRIEDNGKGFDPVALDENEARHFGVQIMRERATSVGGDLVVESQRGAGTRVIFWVPQFPMIEDPHETSLHFAR